MSKFEELDEQQQKQIEDLVREVLYKGPVELEADIRLLDSVVKVKMPDQYATEKAMERAGMTGDGHIRDGLTRDLIFSRLILEDAIVEVNGLKMDKQMNRLFLRKLQPGVIATIFTEYANVRERQNIVINKSIEAAKKSQPGRATD